MATIIDQHIQTEKNNIPFALKIEFNVIDDNTGSSHIFGQTFMRIQNKATMIDRTFCKDFFYNNVVKPFIEQIMKEKGKNCFCKEKFLKGRVLPLNSWKRKQPMKSNQCDICSCIFLNPHGVNVHEKKMHGESVVKSKKSPIN